MAILPLRQRSFFLFSSFCCLHTALVARAQIQYEAESENPFVQQLLYNWCCCNKFILLRVFFRLKNHFLQLILNHSYIAGFFAGLLHIKRPYLTAITNCTERSYSVEYYSNVIVSSKWLTCYIINYLSILILQL